MAPGPTEIVIEFDPRAVPISGHIRADRGTPLAFTGWTGLFAALRAAAGEEVAERRAVT
jgi:hypothetical protein